MHGQTEGEEDSGTVTDHALFQLVICPELPLATHCDAHTSSSVRCLQWKFCLVGSNTAGGMSAKQFARIKSMQLAA